MNLRRYSQSNKLNTKAEPCGPDMYLEEHKQENTVKLATNTRRVGDRTSFFTIASKSKVLS